MGVIEDGKVTFARGYGETVYGSGDPVTQRTLFKIASNSKAMTAALLARLVQQGKLQWDDPVVKYLPEFAMHDAWVTAHMTVNDLLVHNSGLPEGGGDLMLWPCLLYTSFWKQLVAAGHSIASLDVGGGLGVRYREGEHAPAAQDYACLLYTSRCV